MLRFVALCRSYPTPSGTDRHSRSSHKGQLQYRSSEPVPFLPLVDLLLWSPAFKDHASLASLAPQATTPAQPLPARSAMPSLDTLRIGRSGTSTAGRGPKGRSSLSALTDAFSLRSRASFGSSNASAALDEPTVDILLTPSSSVSSGLDSLPCTPPNLVLGSALGLDEETAAFDQLEHNLDASRSKRQKHREEKRRALESASFLECTPS